MYPPCTAAQGDRASSDPLYQYLSDWPGCCGWCSAHSRAPFWLRATANLAALAAEKTLAQADLDDLQAKLDAFNTLLTQPRQAKAITKGATDSLPDKLDAADRILERQMDRLMERYKASNPDFYGAYQVARLIVDAGGGGATPNPPTPPTPPPA